MLRRLNVPSVAFGIAAQSDFEWNQKDSPHVLKMVRESEVKTFFEVSDDSEEEEQQQEEEQQEQPVRIGGPRPPSTAPPLRLRIQKPKPKYKPEAKIVQPLLKQSVSSPLDFSSAASSWKTGQGYLSGIL